MQNTIKYTFFHFLIGVIINCEQSQENKNKQESFFFFQMSDTQFGFFNKNKDYIQDSINFERAISEANQLPLRFVIVTGDLINVPRESVLAAAYKSVSAKLDPNVPFYHLPGNQVSENQVTPEPLEGNRREFGEESYTFIHGNLMGFVLNSSLITDSSLILDEADKQMEWLEYTDNIII